MEFIGITEAKQIVGGSGKQENEAKDENEEEQKKKEIETKPAQKVSTPAKPEKNKVSPQKTASSPQGVANALVSEKHVKVREEMKKVLKRSNTKRKLKVHKKKEASKDADSTMDNKMTEAETQSDKKDQEKTDDKKQAIIHTEVKKEDIQGVQNKPPEKDQSSAKPTLEKNTALGLDNRPRSRVSSSKKPDKAKLPSATEDSDSDPKPTSKPPPPTPVSTPTPEPDRKLEPSPNQGRQLKSTTAEVSAPSITVTPAPNSRRSSLVLASRDDSNPNSPSPVTVNSRPFVTRLLNNPNMQVADAPSSGSALWKRAVNKAKALTMFQAVSEAKPEEKIVYKYYKGRRISVNPITGKRRSMAELQKHVRRVNARRRFRRWGKLIIFCMRCVYQHSYRFREESELTMYIRVLTYMDYRQEEVPDLMFDPTKFRADRKMRISEDTKKILSKHKLERTEHEVYSCQIALRSIRSFAEFPVRMQRMIAEVGQYEAYEAKRVITREGHPPAAYYFILSGSVVAMALDKNHTSATPIGEYFKGDTFEEQPMLHDTPRQYTVLTKEPCELLSISNKDYKMIFMQGGVKNINDPDQETFLRNLSFLDGWPIPLLMDHPKKCQFIYFKRGAIVAKDTHYNDWIIIVKSGSISVLKKLKKVGPNEWTKQSVIKPLTERQKRERVEQRYQWRRFVLPELRLPLRKSRDLDEVEERVDGKPKPFQHPELKFKFDEVEEKGSQRKKNKYFYPNLWTYKRGGDDGKGATQETSFSNINKQYLYLMSGKAGDKRTTGETRLNTNTAPLTRSRTLDSQQFAMAMSPDLASRASFSSSPDPMAYGLRDSPSSSIQSLAGRDRYQSVGGAIRPKSEGALPSVDENPEFVKVQTLVKGQVWGLADLILHDQPSFTVVSNGADLVLINKHFYEEHSSERLQRKMREELCPYPSDDDLQQGLQVSVNWKEYRRRNLTSTLQILPRRARVLNTEHHVAA